MPIASCYLEGARERGTNMYKQFSRVASRLVKRICPHLLYAFLIMARHADSLRYKGSQIKLNTNQNEHTAAARARLASKFVVNDEVESESEHSQASDSDAPSETSTCLIDPDNNYQGRYYNSNKKVKSWKRKAQTYQEEQNVEFRNHSQEVKRLKSEIGILEQKTD